jgi:hypothetical protein
MKKWFLQLTAVLCFSVAGDLHGAPLMFAPVDASLVMQVQRGVRPAPHPDFIATRPGPDATLRGGEVKTEDDLKSERDRKVKDCADRYSDSSERIACEVQAMRSR